MNSYSTLLITLFLLISIFVFGQEQIPETTVGLKSIGKLRTKTTHQIKASNWSVGGETMDRDYTIYKEWSPYLEELGIKKVRLQGGWAKCEKTRGVYSWDWLDEPVFDLPMTVILTWKNYIN